MSAEIYSRPWWIEGHIYTEIGKCVHEMASEMASCLHCIQICLIIPGTYLLKKKPIGITQTYFNVMHTMFKGIATQVIIRPRASRKWCPVALLRHGVQFVSDHILSTSPMRRSCLQTFVNGALETKYEQVRSYITVVYWIYTFGSISRQCDPNFC